ncbi:MAG: sulfur oxidation c-type cytochrome SoxX [Caulobacterales bacterium]|nr:sulfur oxidation c-type cytochrome SoxX [Caulobacterales bacterium]
MRRALAVLCPVIAVSACGGEPEQLMGPAHIAVDDAITTPLTDTPGEAERGRRVFVEREAGHCVLCHVVDALDAPFQGDVGPALSDVGARLTAGQIRLRVVDAARLNPDTVMPPYHRVTGLTQVARGDEGRPILSSQEIEDVVAYLAALKG